MVTTTSISAKGLLPGYILLLSLALAIAGSLNSPSFAEDGLIFPDSANLVFTREVHSDTVEILILNLGTDSLTNFFLSEFTTSQVVQIQCLSDGIPFSDSLIERSFNDIYPGRHTARWPIGSFYQTLSLVYYSPVYSSCELSWTAGHPFAVFGIMPLERGIGAPRNVIWDQ